MYHIVFNADENYIKYLAVTINSIIRHTAQGESKPYHFHILSDFISQATRDKLDSFIAELSRIYPCQITIHTFDDEIFRGFRPWGFEYEHSKNYLAYYRLLFARFLPDSATKCLYLDTDMLVLCDLREIWEIDLGNHILASNSGHTSSKAKWNRAIKSTHDNKTHKFKVPYYFCSGLMFINIAKWKECDIESKCMDFLQHYKSEFANQDALNIVVKGDIAKLPPEYGLLIFQAGNELQNPHCTFKAALQATLQNLKIAHFNGPSHPWLSKYHHLDSNALPLEYPYIDKWWQIALETPIFCDELREIHHTLHSDSHILQCYIKGMSNYITANLTKQNPLKRYAQKCKSGIKKLLQK